MSKQRCIDEYGMTGVEYRAIMEHLIDRVTLKRCEELCDKLTIK